MRILVASTAITVISSACASTPIFGPLGEQSAIEPKITAVDSVRPPRSLSVKVDEPAYVAVLLVAPGHSATLLYPRDSLTDNRVAAGTHQLSIQIPDQLVQADTALLRARTRGTPPVRSDTLTRRGPRGGAAMPGRLPPNARTFLLLVTSPQQLSYSRIIERTAGVSIPAFEIEALNAVGKAVKSTITAEPQKWAGYYQEIELLAEKP